MYEISCTDNKCIDCNKKLGYLDPKIKTFYKGGDHIKQNMFYSHKPHIKIKSIRKRCFDCAFNKFKHFDCRPNVWVSEYFEFLFDVDLSLYRDKRKITLENLQKKYGEEEGKIRFDEYRRKQAESNSLEYKIKKKGWTKEQFDEYNKSRAVTLENLQKKYGEEEGKIRFDEYRRKQA
ncbi:MAG: hypothetical protein ACK41Z_12990, partial [Sediminibacterium sp.]